MRNRILSLLAGLIMIMGMIPGVSLRVEATPNDHPNTYVNTGDQRKDIIGVALTQVGYYEGSNNDTKYGVWYGYNNKAWCGIFVAWCANQAGIPTSVLARTGVADPSAYGLSKKSSGYTPVSGDLFFTPRSGGGYSHVGLVYYTSGDYFYSLEGNTWENGGPEGVYIRKHKISGYHYASPNYQGGGEHDYVKGYESEHPHKEYYECSDCGDRYETGKTGTVDSCIECVQENCSHSFSVWSKVDDSKHSRVCSLCEKQESKNHGWDNGKVLDAATCYSVGSKQQTCTGCGAALVTVIPKTEDHVYGDWTKTDEEFHTRICEVCDHEDSGGHEVPENWFQDVAGHWFNCEVCMEQFGLEEHVFGEGCDVPCEICEYQNPDGHRYTIWRTDEQKHWQTCDGCDKQDKLGNHEFSADCDDTCDTCGYIRPVSHILSEEYDTNSQCHWYTCSVCGEAQHKDFHVPTESKRAGDIQFCTVCHLQLTDPEDHTHAYDTFESDEQMHWGTCSCGLTMEKEAHTWSVQTGACSVCGVVSELPTVETFDFFPWLIWGGVGFLVVVILIAIIAAKRRD